jgi:hypothetical protein
MRRSAPVALPKPDQGRLAISSTNPRVDEPRADGGSGRAAPGAWSKYLSAPGVTAVAGR